MEGTLGNLIESSKLAGKMVGKNGIVRAIYGFSPKWDRWGAYVPKGGPIPFTDEEEYVRYVENEYKNGCYQIYSISRGF